MTSWSRSLDQAGITAPRLRSDFSEQRRLVARFARAEYAAVRLLLPAPCVPDIIAATAFMHHSDNLIDQGSASERAAAFTAWESRVRAALDGGSADLPVLHALLDAITRHPQLRRQVETYLDGAPEEVHWEGFATESDLRRYVDAYSHPAFMLIACLLAPRASADSYAAGCRTFIEASQRLDFLADLAEDLRTGRLGIPEDALTRHGVTLGALRAGVACEALGELVRERAAQIRTGLTASYGLVDLVEARNRPFIRALVTIQELRLRAVEEKGAGLVRGSAGPSVVASLRVLAREHRAARVFTRAFTS
ncbi:squalene/phytoene synthase family protein [Streptomyces sp. RB6PN25]|uniref:Squalene/phytoene synthase family protein n=1 Tax=Streptomyces humicola TaxID=2953240 RepID=A0ABT1PQS4_9ACTN|nr:squalene/phytoene synthase family protein [Streptomyces humicola]MCQ4079493.1 squalene/phytoene synthase family protein [Streptomyces humicola]